LVPASRQVEEHLANKQKLFCVKKISLKCLNENVLFITECSFVSYIPVASVKLQWFFTDWLKKNRAALSQKGAKYFTR